MDLAVNWALLRSVVINTDVQFVLLDRRVQRVLREYALLIGENSVLPIQIAGSGAVGPDSERTVDNLHLHFTPLA